MKVWICMLLNTSTAFKVIEFNHKQLAFKNENFFVLDQ